MKEETMINETEQTTQPVEQPVQETPIAPAPEANTFEQPVAETPVQPEPVAAPEAPVEPTAITQEPVATEPVQTNEQPKKKKSILPALIVIIIILALLCGAAYYLFVYNTDNPVFKMFVKENTTTTTETTTTTVAKLTEEEAKKISLELVKKYNNDGYASSETSCLDDAFEEISNEELDKGEVPCNGVYAASKKFKTMDEVKKYLNEILTTSNTDKVAGKFVEKDNYIWCCRLATEVSYIKENSFEINSVTINEKEIVAEYKYIDEFAEGGEDENGNQGSYVTSTEITRKMIIKNEDNKWKVDSDTFVSKNDLGQKFEKYED